MYHCHFSLIKSNQNQNRTYIQTTKSLKRGSQKIKLLWTQKSGI